MPSPVINFRISSILVTSGIIGADGILSGSLADASNASAKASASRGSVILTLAKILDVATKTPPHK